MKQLLWFLAVLALTASAASAGPNDGGVLWVHDTGTVFSTDLALPPVSVKPADCAGVDNQQDADGVERIWKVYAAFPAGSFPRLKTVGWGIKFPDVGTSASSYVNVSGGGLMNEDGAGTDFDIETDGFPTTSGGMIGQSFPTGPRLTTVIALYWFRGFGYNTGGPLPTWSLVQHTFEGNRVFGDDARPTNEDPITAYGSLGFGTPGSTPCPTLDPSVACCNPTTDACVVMPKSTCVEPSFWHVLFTTPPDVWAGPWYTCTPNPCPPPTSACCKDGACTILTCHPTWNPLTRIWAPCPDGMIEDPSDPLSRKTTEALCRATGGVYKGAGALCASNPCDVAAPCCFPSGVCHPRTQSNCETVYPPGIWHPEWTACGANGRDPCPQPPTGACCVFAGTCTVTTQAACASGSTWHDDWETCAANGRDPCPQPPTGACCDSKGPCEVKNEADCRRVSGSIWHGDWEACLPDNPCPQPIRACCNVLDGTCVDATFAACVKPTHQWHPNSTCDTLHCPAAAPMGACCQPGGACTLSQEVLCIPPPAGTGTGTWHAEWTTCQPDSCPKPQGACCDPLRGGCVPGPEEDCPSPGVWHPAAGVWGTCSPNPCPQPLKGVCCSFPQTCAVDRYEVDCAKVGDVWHTDWVPACLPKNPCPEPPPTGGCCNSNGECRITLPAACVGTPGVPVVWNIGWVTCTPNACPQPPSGACCDRNGLCTLMAQFRCETVDELLTIWHAEFTVCTPNPCPPSIPPGVCCGPKGSCVITVEARCTGADVWTAWGSCTTNPCPLPGACCLPDSLQGTCLVDQAAAECSALHGMYQGNATVCSPNPCVQPTGACCFTNGTCQVRTEDVCKQVSGAYQVDGTTCPPTPACAQPPGACCSATGLCTVKPSSVLCDGQWTIFATCSPDPCALPRGSCCERSGACTVTYARDCATGGRVWKSGAVCSPNPCPPPGACCAPAGTCTVTDEATCVGNGTGTAGTWTLDGVCAPNSCLPPPLGSCCDPADWRCWVTLEAACPDSTDSIGVWTLSGTCNPNLCPPPSLGACCAPAGGCTVTTLAVCNATWTLAGLCDPNPCPQPSGACCSAAGSCVVTLSAIQCDGLWTALATCSPDPCALPRHSCCDLRGTCAITYARDCATGIWMTDAAICDPNPCLPPPGACCVSTGACAVTTQAICPPPDIWHLEWLTCTPNPCPQPSTGACCAEDETCTVTTRADCVLPAAWHGQLPICEPTSCPPITPTQRISWGRVKNLYR